MYAGVVYVNSQNGITTPVYCVLIKTQLKLSYSDRKNQHLNVVGIEGMPNGSEEIRNLDDLFPQTRTLRVPSRLVPISMENVEKIPYFTKKLKSYIS